MYRGEECLNDIQITTLEAFDARRYLLKAGRHVRALDSFCCNVQAVFGDIAFTQSEGGREGGWEGGTELVSECVGGWLIA